MASRAVTSAVLRAINHQITGSSVVVQPNGLESAITRPAMTLHYEPQRQPTYLAATLTYGLIMNHPFLDGNKRTAQEAAHLYLKEAGYELQKRKDRADTVLSAAHAKVATSQMDVEQLAEVYAGLFAKIK